MTNILTKRIAAALVAVSSAFAYLPTLQAEDVTFNLETATLADMQKALDAGAISSVELVTLYLNRRALYDQAGIKLNSVVQISPNVMAEAAAADLRRARDRKISPLDGLPFLTKDSYNSVGVASTGGMSLWKDIFPTQDNFIMTTLKNSGAVFLGHANMDTFANSASNTVSDAFGTTLNAYTLGVPAGSSGGPAVSTAADLTFFAFGGETGGSIRNPSDRGGIVGFKVGVGTIAVSGILALVPDRDVIGPMSRYTGDEAAVMDVAAVQDPNDIWATVNNYIPGRPRPTGFASMQSTTSLAGKRFGVIGTYVGQPYGIPVVPPSSSNTTGVNAIQQDILSIFNRARAELEAQGATTVDTSLPTDIDTAVALPAGSPTRALVTPSVNSTKLQALAHYTYLTGLGQDPVLRLGQVPGGRVSQTLINTVAAKDFLSFESPQGIEHFAAQKIYVQKFENWMNANKFDALIWPVHTTKTRTSANPPGRDLVNNIGLPLCTTPMGVLPSTGEPTTLGFCGRFRQENYLLALAHAYEQATNYRIPSPLTPPIAGESFTYSTTPTASLSAVKAIAPSARKDKLPPVVAIAPVGSVAKDEVPKLMLRGVVKDASTLDSVRVYVNGTEIPANQGSRWLAVMPLEKAQKLSVAHSRKVVVTVLAKDVYGNASATRRWVSVPR